MSLGQGSTLHLYTRHLSFNSPWPSDAIWRYRTWSILVQVAPCCLMTASYNIKQCWLIMSEVLWRSSEGNNTGNTWDIDPLYGLENYYLNSLRANFFQRKHKPVFTFYVIPLHWHAKDNWNTSSYKTRTYLFYILNIMPADVLATQGGPGHQQPWY